MDVNEARELANEFAALNKVVTRQRRRLLRFIRDNQEYIRNPWVRDKATRGYLRDLDNGLVVLTVQEILARRGEK